MIPTVSIASDFRLHRRVGENVLSPGVTEMSSLGLVIVVIIEDGTDLFLSH